MGLVVFGDRTTVGLAGCTVGLGGFDTFDATPTFAGFGCNLAHILQRMMGATVIAEGGCIHRLKFTIACAHAWQEQIGFPEQNSTTHIVKGLL